MRRKRARTRASTYKNTRWFVLLSLVSANKCYYKWLNNNKVKTDFDAGDVSEDAQAGAEESDDGAGAEESDDGAGAVESDDKED
jgi:hypothetical protein